MTNTEYRKRQQLQQLQQQQPRPLPEYLQSFSDSGISDARLRRFDWLHPKHYASEGSLSDDFTLSPYGTSVSSPRGDEWEIVDRGPRKSIDELWDEVFDYQQRIKVFERTSQAQDEILEAAAAAQDPDQDMMLDHSAEMDIEEEEPLLEGMTRIQMSMDTVPPWESEYQFGACCVSSANASPSFSMSLPMARSMSMSMMASPLLPALSESCSPHALGSSPSGTRPNVTVRMPSLLKKRARKGRALSESMADSGESRLSSSSAGPTYLGDTAVVMMPCSCSVTCLDRTTVYASRRGIRTDRGSARRLLQSL
ncbi:hypothetical protein BGW38_004434 [Lunasporangiospora selenospora]|uniref:Uncharacterized protein n=1 Tax=Lunasporangiospora selenospora TaxID=979761 RepID=A0A9P6FPB1_9FUNG|nr:hypothetical protein BGW38_004434 [Lunasporangiospora selenospora]